MNYLDKLKDPRWQKKRLQILKRDAFTCQDCGETTKTLHIHHKRYIRGHEPWEYKNWMLTTVCEDCHERRHAEKKPVASTVQVSVAVETGEKKVVPLEVGKSIFAQIRAELNS